LPSERLSQLQAGIDLRREKLQWLEEQIAAVSDTSGVRRPPRTQQRLRRCQGSNSRWLWCFGSALLPAPLPAWPRSGRCQCTFLPEPRGRLAPVRTPPLWCSMTGCAMSRGPLSLPLLCWWSRGRGNWWGHTCRLKPARCWDCVAGGSSTAPCATATCEIKLCWDERVS